MGKVAGLGDAMWPGDQGRTGRPGPHASEHP